MEDINAIRKILAEGGKSISVIAEQIVFVRQKLDRQNDILEIIANRLERLADNQ